MVHIGEQEIHSGTWMIMHPDNLGELTYTLYPLYAFSPVNVPAYRSDRNEEILWSLPTIGQHCLVQLGHKNL